MLSFLIDNCKYTSDFRKLNIKSDSILDYIVHPVIKITLNKFKVLLL